MPYCVYHSKIWKTSFSGTHCSTICRETVGVQCFWPTLYIKCFWILPTPFIDQGKLGAIGALVLPYNYFSMVDCSASRHVSL